MSGRLPLIGVTGRRFERGRTFATEASVAIQSDYADAISRAGGVGAVLAPEAITEEQALGRMDVLDGLLLTGGSDVDPARYFQQAAPEVYEVSELQDTFELAMLAAAIELAKPVLAICRGAQLVNVAFGGTLLQHITGQPGFGAHGIPNGGGGSANTYAVEADSLLEAVVGTHQVEGMCHHHQAIDRVGNGLRVSARTSDGTVEAVELDTSVPRSWLLAVQWHPEETAAHDLPNQRLFDHLVAAARR